MEVMKVVKRNRATGVLTSCIVRSKFEATYVIGTPTFPPIKGSKLFSFSTIEEAKSFLDDCDEVLYAAYVPDDSEIVEGGALCVPKIWCDYYKEEMANVRLFWRDMRAGRHVKYNRKGFDMLHYTTVFSNSLTLRYRISGYYDD